MIAYQWPAATKMTLRAMLDAFIATAGTGLDWLARKFSMSLLDLDVSTRVTIGVGL